MQVIRTRLPQKHFAVDVRVPMLMEEGAPNLTPNSDTFYGYARHRSTFQIGLTKLKNGVSV